MKAIYDQEMAQANAPTTVNPLGLTFLAPTVMALGTEEQKRSIIKPLLHNEVIWCQGFSEPGAGSDLAALQMKAERQGDSYVVNGQKIWTTNAMHGDKIFTMARTSPSEGSKHAGISMLLVDMHQDGVEARPLKQMTGQSEFGEVFFTDALCPVEEVLGGEGNGWQVAMLLLSFERGVVRDRPVHRVPQAVVRGRPPRRQGGARRRRRPPRTRCCASSWPTASSSSSA